MLVCCEGGRLQRARFKELYDAMPHEIEIANPDVFQSLMREDRVFPPPAEFAAKAWIGSEAEYERMYRRSVEDSEGFWGDAAGELEWFKKWDQVLDGSGPHAKWFVGGKLNVSHNCVDRHAMGVWRDKVALLWEGEPGEVRRLTFGELHERVQRFANVLKSLGVKKGERGGGVYGDVPGAGDCGAGLRANWGGAFGDLWGVCGTCDCGPGEGLGLPGGGDAGH